MIISSSASTNGDALYSLGCEMQYELDNVLFQAIERRQGGKVDLLSFAGRLNCVKRAGDDHEVCCLDGAPILRVWPAKVERARGPAGDVYVARQRIEPALS